MLNDHAADRCDGIHECHRQTVAEEVDINLSLILKIRAAEVDHLDLAETSDADE